MDTLKTEMDTGLKETTLSIFQMVVFRLSTTMLMKLAMLLMFSTLEQLLSPHMPQHPSQHMFPFKALRTEETFKRTNSIFLKNIEACYEFISIFVAEHKYLLLLFAQNRFLLFYLPCHNKILPVISLHEV